MLQLRSYCPLGFVIEKDYSESTVQSYDEHVDSKGIHPLLRSCIGCYVASIPLIPTRGVAGHVSSPSS